MGFTKLDSGIVDSSVWSEPNATRVVWITILAKCDPDGMVRASWSGLHRACNVTQEEFDEAMKTLASPDPDSRSPKDEGRRVKKVDGGWLVINHGQYRQFSYSMNPEAVKKRLQRGDVEGHVPNVPKCPGHSASASASGSASSSEEGDARGGDKIVYQISKGEFIGIPGADFEAWVAAYPACNIGQEILKMQEWLKANPTKAPRSNYRRFIVNWLSRQQDRGGSTPSNRPEPAEIRREKLVGSVPSVFLPEQVDQGLQKAMKCKALAKEIFEVKYGPAIDAAKSADGKEILREQAEDEYRLGVGKIMRGET